MSNKEVFELIKDNSATLHRLEQLVTKLDNRIEMMEGNIQKLDEVHSILSNLSTKVSSLEIDVNKIKAKQVDFESKTNWLKEKHIEILKQCEEDRLKLDGVEKEIIVSKSVSSHNSEEIECIKEENSEHNRTLYN
ncbi:hypothetical protein SNE40_009724 [Patella caerulea]|uniref:Uncharacterized protein n=1 Tax=Patella caerulea TaxID=87958 RepID=A0AAN8PS42_PATCE